MTANQKVHQAGFTLVELLVSLVIVVILSSLTLSGLARLRSQAKVDKTTTTIRKLHEIVWPLVGGICTRRLEEPSGSSFFVAPSGLTGKRLRAWQRRELIRRQQILEMPETWNEVADISGTNYLVPTLGVQLTDATSSQNFTAPIKAYAARKNAVNPSADYAAAECLFMIVAFSGDPDILETFHSSEIGDKDGDGAPEFHDGWGKPILFMRWAPGITLPLPGITPGYSQIQSSDPSMNPDFTDPMRLDTSEHGLIPLIWSAGPDDSLNDWNASDPGYGFRANNDGWLAAIMNAANGSPSVLYQLCTSTNGQALTPNAADNITNHAIPLR